MAAKLRAFAEAAGRRLGADGVNELVRNARAAQDGHGAEPREREGLAGAGRALAAELRGRLGHAAALERAAERERQVERERSGHRQERGMER